MNTGSSCIRTYAQTLLSSSGAAAVGGLVASVLCHHDVYALCVFYPSL